MSDVIRIQFAIEQGDGQAAEELGLHSRRIAESVTRRCEAGADPWLTRQASASSENGDD